MNGNTIPMMGTRLVDLDALKMLALKAAEMRAIANTTEVHWQEISAGAFDILYSISSLWGKVAPGYVEMDIKRRNDPQVRTMAEKYYKHYYLDLLEELQAGSHQGGGVGKSIVDNWVAKLQTQLNNDRKYILGLIRDVQAINSDAFGTLDSLLVTGYVAAATTKVLADLGGILVGGWIGSAVNLTWTLTATGIGFASPIIIDLINNWDAPQQEELIVGVTLPKGTQGKVADEFGNSMLGLITDDTVLKPVVLNVWQVPREQALRHLAENVNQGVITHADAVARLGQVRNLSDNMRRFNLVTSNVGKGLQLYSIFKSVSEYYDTMQKL